MKCILLLGLLAVAKAHPGLVSYSYANPAGVTFRNTGGTLPAVSFNHSTVQNKISNYFITIQFTVHTTHACSCTLAKYKL